MGGCGNGGRGRGVGGECGGGGWAGCWGEGGGGDVGGRGGVGRERGGGRGGRGGVGGGRRVWGGVGECGGGGGGGVWGRAVGMPLHKRASFSSTDSMKLSASVPSGAFSANRSMACGSFARIDWSSSSSLIMCPGASGGEVGAPTRGSSASKSPRSWSEQGCGRASPVVAGVGASHEAGTGGKGELNILNEKCKAYCSLAS